MESHLLQMRGLKRKCQRLQTLYYVASFTDAWIETLFCLLLINDFSSRIFYRCVD